MITREDIAHLAYIHNVNISNYPINMLYKAFKVEWEHHNTVNGNVDTVFKIVLDHLREAPDYYNRLKSVEEQASNYWKKHSKPKLFIELPKKTYTNIKHA